MSNVNDTLLKRGQVYGDFGKGITLESEIMSNITGRYYAEHGKEMDPWFFMAISKIVMKLSRISTSPSHIDSWHDIAGYAVLIENHLKKEQNA